VPWYLLYVVAPLVRVMITAVFFKNKTRCFQLFNQDSSFQFDISIFIIRILYALSRMTEKKPDRNLALFHDCKHIVKETLIPHAR
jgi:hypothetical protein